MEDLNIHPTTNIYGCRGTLHFGVEPSQAGQTPTDCSVTPQHPEKEQPYITTPLLTGCPRGCWLPCTHPLTSPLQMPWAQAGGSPRWIGHPIPLAAPSQPCVNQEVEASQQFIFSLFFSPLNKKQNRMHKPHVRAHSTQWRVLHFASFQCSEIPGQWCRADIPQISIMPLSTPGPTLAK